MKADHDDAAAKGPQMVHPRHKVHNFLGHGKPCKRSTITNTTPELERSILAVPGHRGLPTTQPESHDEREHVDVKSFGRKETPLKWGHAVDELETCTETPLQAVPRPEMHKLLPTALRQEE